jgi:DNA mismatch endonuclease (patch repair protein)
MAENSQASLESRKCRRRKVRRTERGLVTDDHTSKRLGRIRQRGTAPELVARQIISSFGHRYTTRNRDLPGSPDLANRRRRWAVFVHGCYWHSHAGCYRATVPKRNRAFWEAKFAANRARDAAAVARLKKLGFRTLVLWECETEVASAGQRVRRFFRNQRG